MPRPDAEASGRYGREGDAYLIEIRLKEARQLFHSLDPAPFREKDLDADAEAYIVESVEDLPAGAPVRIVVHLSEPTEEHASGIPEAVRGYFAYRTESIGRQLRETLRLGRVSLAIGAGFLVACLSLRRMLPGIPILQEGLLIMGWVALWRPVQIFLYDWWPIRRAMKTHARIAAMPVEVRPAR